MTAAAAALALAGLAALLDLALPAPAAPSGVRRLLRAAPAGVLAVTLRIAGAPPLPAAALLAFAVADAMALDGRELGVGGWTLTLLGDLLLAAALWELASPALLLRQPWRGVGAAALLAAAVLLARGDRRLRDELAGLAIVAALLLAAAAAGAGAQPATELAWPFAAGIGLWAAEAAYGWRRGAVAGLGRIARALRSAAAFALAAPLLPHLV